MRTFLAALCLAMLATAAPAGQPLPRFKEGSPYPTVRAQLIRMGYSPVPLKTKPGAEIPHCRSHDAMCAKYPEIVACTCCGVLRCLMLFERRSDGHMFGVHTAGEPSLPEWDFTVVQYAGRRELLPHDLDEVVIANGGRRGPGRPR